MIPKTNRTTLSILAALIVGLVVGTLYRPYQLTTSPQRTIKMNRITGSAWVYHWELGQWVKITNH